MFTVIDAKFPVRKQLVDGATDAPSGVWSCAGSSEAARAERSEGRSRPSHIHSLLLIRGNFKPLSS